MAHIKKISNHEQVASLVDLRSLGHDDTKLPSRNVARPAIKLTGKENDTHMQIIAQW
jgi:hypothetical protein